MTSSSPLLKLPIVERSGHLIIFSVVRSIMDTREFEWESQLRFYWDQLPDELMVRQCTGEFGYGYEYMGLNGRLVITPLTDRIYLTISQVSCTVRSKKIRKGTRSSGRVW